MVQPLPAAVRAPLVQKAVQGLNSMTSAVQKDNAQEEARKKHEARVAKNKSLKSLRSVDEDASDGGAEDAGSQDEDEDANDGGAPVEAVSHRETRYFSF